MTGKDKTCNKRDKRRAIGNSLAGLFSILLFTLLSSFVFAIPSSLTLQGKLTNLAGSSLSGTYTMVFRIYDIPGFSYFNISNQTSEDNTAIHNATYINYTNILWEENRTVTTDANGIYEVVLRNLSALNFSEQYYLGIMVGDDNESIPRINLTSAPYAFRANISEDLNRQNRYEVSVLNVTGNLTLGEGFADVLTATTGRLNISDGSIKAAGNLTLAEKISFSLGSIIDNLVNGFVRINSGLNVTGNASIAQDTLFVDNTSGRVGIGTAAPDEKLTVIGGAIRTDKAFKDAFAWNTYSQKQALLSLTQTGWGSSSVSPGNVFGTTTSWSAYNASNTSDLDTRGFIGAVFDGRYIYFSPQGYNDNINGRVLRYDTTSNFTNSSSWLAYDAGSTDGLNTKGYQGAIFDGRYVYFIPFHDNASVYNAIVLRYDTTGSFTASSAWSAYNAGNSGGLTNTKGYVGGVFDGKYIYFVPNFDSVGQHGKVLRYNTTASFTDSSSWSAYNAGSTDGLSTKGYIGGVFDGKYIYFVPYWDGAVLHAKVLRYDTAASFTTSSSWSAYNAGSAGGLTNTTGYAGAVFDGRYIYFSPAGDPDNLTAHGRVLRYDTSGNFTASSAWSAYDAGNSGGLTNTKGYSGPIFDGRYIYFIPERDDNGRHGKVLRYDTTGSFMDSSAWSAYNANNTDGLNTIGYQGGTFDGRYIYFSPNVDDTGQHGKVLRYDTGSPSPQQGILQVARSKELYIDSSGRVGIGTTSPATTLDVKGKANFTGNFSVGETSNIFFVDNTSGRVGIGTALPKEKLTVIGAANITGRFVINDSFEFDGANKRLGINKLGPGAALDVEGNASISGNLSVGGNLSVDGSTLFVDSSGNRVGIGTTIPYNELTVAGSAGVSGSLNASSINTTGSAYFATSSGSVGIGTATPNDALEVIGNVRVSGSLNATSINTTKFITNELIINKNLTVNGDLRATGFVNFTNNTAFNQTLYVVNGNVGIGTTTPDNLLTVLGNEITANAILHLNASDNYNKSVANVMTLDHVLKNGVNSTGGIGVSILFRATDNASQLANLANISAILYNATNGSQLSALTFSTRGADTGDGSFGHLTERMRIDGHGRVGINTTSPTRALHVIGDANITGRLDVGKLNITGVTFSQGDIDAAGSLRVAGGANISGDLGVSGKIGAGTLSPITTLDVKGKANFTGNFSIMNASDTIFFVDNTSGRVGIGTGSPSWPLHVSGTTGDSESIVAEAGGTVRISLRTGTRVWAIGIDGTLSDINTFTIRDRTGSADRLVITTAGRVGIGNTIPNATLDVSGNVYLSAANPMINISGPIIRKSGNDIVISD